VEPYRLATTEKEFWQRAARPRKMAEVHGERLVEYLKRVMLHSVPYQRASPAVANRYSFGPRR
jgi:hypothetical protein